jgi:hypothetical protein
VFVEQSELLSTGALQLVKRSITQIMSDYDGEGDYGQDGAAQNLEQLVKKLVRYSLACEYSRQPIRRADITYGTSTHGRKMR